MEDSSSRKKKRTRQIVLLLFAVILLASAVSVLLSTYGLVVTHYEAASQKLTASVRIVHLTDLHNSEFGRENSRLISKVSAQEPDLILISGDLLDQHEMRTDIAEKLIRDLAEIAPVYVSFGNHETAYKRIYGKDIGEIYTAAGAEVLHFSTAEITVNGQNLMLGGLYGYALPANIFEASARETEFLKKLEDQDVYTILLCHMPVSWLLVKALEAWHFDCVLCGHVHGGQIRFPLIGGLWAPDQGWFPGEDCGMYYSKDGTRFMELSRGLGSTERIPRFNNIPEIVVIDLLSESGGD